MEKKKVIYQITKKKYQTVEVDTEEQEELIKELNRDFEREEKREKTARARCLSLDELSQNGGDVADESPNAEEIYFEKEEDEQIKSLVHNALKCLTDRQREVVIKVFWDKATFREIGEELGVHFTTVAEIYQSAIKKLKKFLQNTPTNRP